MADRAVVSTNQFRSPRGTVTTSSPTIPVLTLTAGRAAFEDSGVAGAFVDETGGRAEIIDTAPGTLPFVVAVGGRVLMFG